MPKVSAGISFGQNAASLVAVLGTIDATHTDGVLPPIVVHAAAGAGFGGAYKFPTNGTPSIHVRQPCLANEFSFVHDVGHFIDHKALDPANNGFASQNIANNDLADWARAVLRSSEVAALRLLHTKLVDIAQTTYLLDVRELWARSYTQWVTQRSQDARLLDELRRRRSSTNSFRALSQWEDSSFAAIHREIDQLFAQRGWI